VPPSELQWDLTALLHGASPAVLDVSLQVSNSGRESVSHVVVEIAAVPIPSVNIADPPAKYSSSERVVLTGTAERAEELQGTAGELLYEWTADRILAGAAADGPGGPEGGPGEGDQGPAGQASMTVDLQTISATRTTSPVLVVQSDTLAAGATYRFTLTVFDGPYAGQSKVAVAINQFDQVGTLSVSPADGLAISDTFRFQAAGFEDTDIPLVYSFARTSADGDWLLTESSGSAVTDGCILAAGEEGVDFRYEIIANVVDSYGAAASARADIRVRPYKPYNRLAIDAAAHIQESSEDSQQTLQLVSAFAAGLNSGETAGDDIGDATDTRDLLSTALLRAASEAVGDTSVALIAESLVAVTAEKTQLTEASLALSFETMELITDDSSSSLADNIDSLARTTSNLLQASAAGVVDNSSVTKNFAQAASEVVNKLGTALVADAVPGEDPRSVETDAYELMAQKNRPAGFEGQALPGADIMVPVGAFQDVPTGNDIVAQVTAWRTNPFFYDNATVSNQDEAATILTTSVLSIEFRTSQGEGLEVRGLAEPFLVTLTVDNSSGRDGAADDWVPYCAYYNITQERWVLDDTAGLGNMTSNTSIVCSFDHLTDFSAFVGPPKFRAMCTSDCLAKFWANPWAVGIVVTFATVVFVTWLWATHRWCFHHSIQKHSDFHESDFAVQRQKILAPDVVENTGCFEDSKHRFSHDYTFGGLVCPIGGQKTVLFVRFYINMHHFTKTGSGQK